MTNRQSAPRFNTVEQKPRWWTKGILSFGKHEAQRSVCTIGGLILLSVYLMAACAPAKRSGNQYLLFSQSVKGNQTIDTEELEALIPRRPNKRLLQLPFTPGLWIYQGFSGKYDPEQRRKELEALTVRFEQESQVVGGDSKALKKLNRRFNREARRDQKYIEKGNWVMRNFGEPPVYFVQADAQADSAKMRLFLRKKGFRSATVRYTVDTLADSRVRVNYIVSEGIPSILRSISYDIPDKRIDSLVGYSLSAALIKANDRLDEDKVFAESVRIEELLRNSGYYSFSRQYIIPFGNDTIQNVSGDKSSQPVDLTMQILNPPGKSAHPVYYVGDVQMTLARDPKVAVDTVRRNGIRYFLEPGMYSTRLLDTKISLRPGALYRLKDYADTQRQLFLLNQFRFANVNFTDTTGRRLRTVITATPLDKYDITTELGATVLYYGQGFPGPYANAALRVRNLFGGLETFEVAARFGLEAQLGFAVNKVLYSQEFGLTTSLIFPQILFPGKTRFLFNELNPRTQLSLGYTITDRPDYTRRNLRGTMTYLWQRTQTQQFNASIVDVNYLQAGIQQTDIGAQFQKSLDSLTNEGSTIGNSFRNAFFSSISFGYTYNTNILGQNKRANFFRTTLESGGTTLNLLKTSAVESLSQSSGLNLYKYLRTNVDYRHYLPISSRALLAFRVNAGVVFGYGSNLTAPYEKRFFAGGSNSVRAWLPRRLGLGASYPRSFTLSDGTTLPVFANGQNGEFDYRFEQPGDVLVEGSAELRARLFHFGADINGAVFVDAGNVWLLRDPGNNPNAVFRPGTFYQQLAVGTGVGLRLDFSFFVIRFDFAVKAYDPSRRYVDATTKQLVDERFILNRFSFKTPFSGTNPVNVVFGIGYPF
ncbi:translocation and assembly module lipoprotein TamL [Fibrella forsythiae]|uniref:BamA/TamA family outer membrane protein n=1 Tax=Fibrella forsythiae TaxID=2817061 RepID=A0ABS3JDR2_9BACT|nr:BamA/TamA family outer membrane protein [Fibrella forsythiae]MBO0948128.1 BamA/TamA family outer membrane protein [Fibrella forsythiae]